MSTESDPFAGGGADDGGATAAPSEPAHNSAPAPASHDGGDTGGSADDIEALLSEFEAGRGANASATDATAAESAAPARVNLNDVRAFSDDDMLKLSMDVMVQRARTDAVLQQYQQERWQQQESADFAEVLSEAGEYLNGLPVAEDFAKRWFLAEAQLDPNLKEVWDHRRDSPEHQAYAVRALKRAFKKMQHSAKRTPDPHATEDRAAVTAAVRGAGGRVPDSVRPNYERMNPAEFAAEKDRLFGK